ncbi:MAG: hypothetical protein A2600_12570 [Candidatus Lambdaproteobacteria bacterium RIFOXYD1_FULL_56_27]|uniref:Rhodanese domain-containing protein n=1 Tax=Candidatus Lambdaproteobacteria bacterium RIFOXYD2_FULL_56_26 TaxID=1817773 RepID=A0A1F6GT02_9PROT|nr:MAG: hypothetical protein A2426_07245 [Candidatus Lambdaproteobacteria bacterium RIFOXYC1_FULL_56_13]OGH01214.1 MAG: hypothetical protein A2557_00970 [Candidatus Lambdaproteobacteria bacterium RIFOXYD2_FULL_56_26]OGH06481.1 MAG: hypothetical protein A2600_12570 [Candidatus Lambdaproteobacteria bacterium RIFOXYD1_FULL_56_27]
MELKSYTAQELWDWAFGSVPKFLLLDVRNDKDFARSKVEAPGLWVQNLSYIDFIEEEAESLGKVAAQKDQPVRIVCAKDGSARYVAEVLVKAGFSNVASLAGGITTWGDLLVHKLVHLDQEFELYQFQRPGKGSLSYALVGHAQMWVFDPARVLEPYLTLAKSKGVVITNLFETHLQADYVSGGKALAAATGAKLWGHPGDFAGADYKIGPVTDHQNWELSKNLAVTAIHTPGHTPGSTSYQIAGTFLLTGDALLIHSLGRPDLGGMWEPWAKEEFVTLETKIKAWPDSQILLPGHFSDWTERNPQGLFARSLGEVKALNPEIFLPMKEDEFLAYIQGRVRPQPEEYSVIRTLNLGQGEKSEAELKELDLGKNQCAASTH